MAVPKKKKSQRLSKSKKTTFLIVGKHAVVEALKNPKRKIEKVFVTEDAQKNLNRENQSLNLFKNSPAKSLLNSLSSCPRYEIVTGVGL